MKTLRKFLTSLSLGFGCAALPLATFAAESAIGTAPIGSASSPVKMAGAGLTRIQTGALYPEGVEYDPATGKFLLCSFREGIIYEVDEDGSYRPLVRDERLVTGLGIRVDSRRNRLLVATADLGISTQRSSAGTTRFAALGIYQLSTGRPLSFVDLGALRPAGESHLANDVAIDADGNAYVTDSLAPVIYRVDLQGHASVFLESKEMFDGEGINLNGIVFNPKGYLIVVKKSDGALFKVPLDNPGKFSKIATSRKFIGGDGLVFIDEKNLLLITNRVGGTVSNTVYALASEDNWDSGQVGGEYKFASDDYPTTGVVKDGKIYVTEGKINRLLSDWSAEKASGYSQKAAVQQVGSVIR